MSQYFTEGGVGERYAAYRPKVHQVVLKWLHQHLPGRRFARAVDVGCGTGDSMVPLLDLCDEVIGVDSSEEMLKLARQRSFSVVQGDYSLLTDLGKFDLISACMAFNWFEAARAIAAYKAASNPGAIWLIYGFAFAGHTTSEEFNQWFRESYLTQYPSPPRGPSIKVKPESDTEIRLVVADKGWLPIEFNRETLVGFLSTQSNIEEAVRQGGIFSEICKGLMEQIADIDLSGPSKYVYNYEILEYVGKHSGD